jgi:RING-box protein 1
MMDDQQKMDAKPKEFTLNKWNTVALWSWDMEQANCAICKFIFLSNSRTYLGDKCVSCQADANQDKECLPEFVCFFSFLIPG